MFVTGRSMELERPFMVIQNKIRKPSSVPNMINYRIWVVSRVVA